MARPLIGLTLDSEEPGGYAKLPWYASRQNYADCVSAAGGLPFFLPHETALAAEYLERLDGLIVTGGDFDLDPAHFGAADRHPTVKTKDRRTDFELAIARAALESDLPLFGICGGQQLLHVALGGELIQHIPDAVKNALAHEQPNPRTEAGHEVAVVPGTLLHAIVGSEGMAVNSAHHQAAGEAGPGVVVSARSSDGVIEAIEHPGYGFCLGVQWHPEYLIDPGDALLFAALIAAG
ncbi:MAG TPA: gamma-glutamyl-gamma-aminobutyrate hydrolase family protein [Alphaproteobacteria bacterium]|jgi:putative glutamine amidotransferase|nr:gamma-glutamyl-gamma-aminobutyrate hydrolase family protein [Alphaproteobacteria bacterium]MDP6269731.1 gamma-glutamyl-gamma-aminobutyrate hydrolase family protein [Alphaproteobacteria bacterium]MDP7165079.1 gamma-glutamyl-gamma-aminobutyrate hydrolase family protein [Alphaproteobacteria bacterium]MDP7429111.1 gamma-glutamyl-gamma-aminobutyrate hydrolase family protein [Alphaproteobacteria bacterium]HJM51513.1 gamma-glutamyl-gamma-aminobutyrate hydrolase family protein [Alphaproteobacteria b